MSYDVDIADECFNYTYNVSALFYDHMEGGINSLNGLTGRKACERIGQCFAHISDTKNNLWNSKDVGEPKFCAKYDAPNGWGSAVGGLLFLANIMAACDRHPRSIVRVS